MTTQAPDHAIPTATHSARARDGRTNAVARAIRQAADRLQATSMASEAEGLNAVAERLRAMADTLRDDTADQLVETVSAIARNSPATLVAGSVMAGFALEGEGPAAAPGARPGFLEEALKLFREGEGQEAAQHPLPVALAAASIAWLLANPEEARQPAHDDATPPAGAIGPGGMGYFMTLNRDEEETIDWAKPAA